MEEYTPKQFDPDLEFVEMWDMYKGSIGDNLLFVTITLKPKLYKFQALTQYEITCLDIDDLLEQTGPCSVVTELTKDANVHYHALIKMRDKYHRMHFINKAKKIRSIGFVKISPEVKETDELERVIHYMLKDIPNTQKIISRPGYKPELLKHL